MKLILTLGLAALTSLSTQAQTVQYLYDETGRLVGTVAPSGDSAYYSYDPAGNITATRRVTAGTIDLIEFTPNSGLVGSTVTLWGSGFSTTPSLNAVRFNGVSATVFSATANKLMVTVPAGATTGPIAITSPAGTVTSASNFTVLTTSGVPTITSFTPSMGPVGTAVTITGTNFDPLPGATKVEFNSRPSAGTGVTTTSINTLAPTGSGGRIRVATVAGSVTSAADFLILPSSISAADVLVSKRAYVGGAAQVLNISTASKVGALLFDGVAGQYLTLNLTAFAPSLASASVPFEIYAPNGALIQSGNVSATVRSFHLPALLQSGTYVVYFKPGVNTVNLSAAVSANALLATDGTALNQSTTFAGQSLRLRFNGTAGKDWVMNLSGLTLTGSGSYLNYVIKKPDGSVLPTYNCSPTSTTYCSQAIYPLSMTGTYTIEIKPLPDGVTGSFVVKSWDSNRVAGALTVGTSSAVATTAPGQIVQYTFSGTSGQQLGLTLTGFTTSVSGATLYAVVLKPDGSSLVSTTFNAAATTPTPKVMDIPALPVTGTYTVQVYPYVSYYDTSLITTFTGQVLLTQDVSATMTTDGTPTNVSITSPGQTARISFTGTAGKDWVMNFSSLALTGTSPYLNYTVKKPDGSTLLGGNCAPTSATYCSQAKYPLPVTGTYTIEVKPYPDGGTGSFTVKSWESSRVAGSLTVGATSTVTSTVPGQIVEYTFSGTSGQQLGLALSTFTTSVSGATLYAVVLKPDGSTLVTTTFNAAATAPAPKVMDIPALPVTGTYTVQVYPYVSYYDASVITTFTGQVLLTSDVAVTMTTDGTPTNVAISLPGQKARISFNGTAGKDWVVNFSGLTLTGTSPYLNYAVKKPDGSTLLGGNCAPTSATYCSQLAYPLPVTGTYTIEVKPYPDGGTGSFTVKSWESSRVAGTLTVGTSSTMTSTVPGQIVEYTFSGTTGQQLGLTLTSFTTSVSGATLYAVVLKPDGSVLVTTPFNAAATAPTPKVLDIPVLPVTGTYTLRVYPYPSAYDASFITTFTGQVLLTQDVAATMTTDGTPTNVSITSPGQTARISFTGTAGKDWAVNLSGLTLTGTSPYLNYIVKKPDGSMLVSGNCAPTSASYCSQLAYPLPVTGMYTIEVKPYPDGGTGSFTVKSWESSRVAGTLTVGTSSTMTSTVPGQIVEYTFSGTAGQQLGLTLTSFTTSVSSATLYAVVLKPDGSSLVTTTFNAAATAPTPRVIDIPALPVTGTYMVRVYPYPSASDASFITTFTGQVLLTQDVAATMTTDGTPTNVSIPSPGQTARISFTGTAGKDWAVNFSGLTLTGTSPYLNYIVKKPDGSMLVSGNCAPTSTSYCSQLAYPLPVTGTYTIEVKPYPDGGTGSFTVKSWESSRVVGTLTVGTTSTLTSTVPGQIVEYAFSGTSGQQLGLTLTSFTTSVSGATLYAVVLKPDGSTLVTTTFNAAATAPTPRVIDIPALPVTGTYTVRVYPYPSASDASFITTFTGQVLLTQDVVATMTTDGTPTNVSIPSPGQTARISFTGTAGKDWAVNFSGLTLTGTSPYLNYIVKKPDGSMLVSGNCAPTSTSYCSQLAYPLPVTGTYTIEVKPYPDGGTGSFTVKSWESSRVAGTLTVGTSSAIASTVPGQIVEYTFSGTAGQQLGLTLTSFTTSVSSATLYAVVLKPDGSTLVTTTFNAAATAPVPKVVDIPVLPVTGTYTVRVYPYPSASDASFITTFTGQVLLTQDVAATMTTDGTPTNVSITQPGQTARISFNGTAGKDWVMNFSSLALTGTSPYLNYIVKKPDGSTLITGNCAPTSTSYCSNLSYNLPVSGTYTIEVRPYPDGSTGSFTVKSWDSSRVTGAFTLGSTSTLTSTVPGQVVQYTFSGTAGQLLGLTLTSFTTSVSGATLYAVVLKPDGSTLTSTNFRATDTAPVPKVLAIPALPVSGTYTVQVYPYFYSYDASIITTFTGQALLNPR